MAQGWYGEARPTDLHDVKGVVDLVLSGCGLSDIRYSESSADGPGAWGLDVMIGKRWIGSILRIDDEVSKAYDLRDAAFIAELDFTALCDLATAGLRVRFTPVSRFPVVQRDIAVVVDASQAAGPMISTIRQSGQPLLQDVQVFDLYEGEHVGAGNKSIAFGLRLGADRTLRDKDVDKVVSRILSALDAEFGAKLRG